MNYAKLSIEELSRFRYPNLVAEIIESGYSICTLSDHMGYGRCEENDPVIRDKVFGKGEFTKEEAVGLAGLFGSNLDYLFADELNVFGGKSVAFYRHYEINQRLKKDLAISKLADKLKERMKKDEDFFLLLQMVLEREVDDINFALKGEVA